MAQTPQQPAPAKQALASRQMKSRYLEALIARKKPHGV